MYAESATNAYRDGYSYLHITDTFMGKVYRGGDDFQGLIPEKPG